MASVENNMLRRLVQKIILALSACSISPAMADFGEILISNYVYELRAGNERTAYLFGSTHYTAGAVPMQLGQCTKDLVTKSESIYLESSTLAFNSLPDSAKKTVSMRLVTEYLSKDTLNDFNKTLFGRATDNDLRQLHDLDALTLLNFLNAKIPGTTQILGAMDYGLDVELAMAARFLNIPLKYIESPEEQLSFFRKTPAKDYATAMEFASQLKRDTNGSASSYLQNYLLVFKAVAQGDEEKLLQIFSTDGFAGYYKHTIFDRNESLANKVDATIRNQGDTPVFIALGAAHLVGNDSVIQKLASRGFKAKRLCN